MYSLESAIAEKLEAIVSLGTFSSRLKDYFDVWYLINNHDLNKGRLRKAILTTFEKRSTPIEDFRYIFSTDFKSNENKSRQWKAFLNRSSIQTDYSFGEVVSEMETLVKSLFDQYIGGRTGADSA